MLTFEVRNVVHRDSLGLAQQWHPTSLLHLKHGAANYAVRLTWFVSIHTAGDIMAYVL